MFAIGDGLLRRGWYLDRQGPPPSLHATVNAVHAAVMDQFVVDLREASAEAREQQVSGNTRAYGSCGVVSRKLAVHAADEHS